MKTLSSITLVTLALFANQSQAQKERYVPAAEEKNTVVSTSTATSGNSIPEINLIPQFRAIWCKSIDTSANGPIDYKGVRVGDLCQAPDDLIAALLNIAKPLLELVTPNAFQEGNVFLIDNLVAGEKIFKRFALMINPYKGKVYIASFSGLICASDSTNNLNEGNPFRKALESKYGTPASVYTEYDQIEAQTGALKAMLAVSKSQAITVQEAKTARDGTNVLNSLKPTQAEANNLLKKIKSLTWDYEKGNKFRPINSASILKANPEDLRAKDGCLVKVKQGRGFEQYYGFILNVFGSQAIDRISDEINMEQANRAKQKVQSAPVPKF